MPRGNPKLPPDDHTHYTRALRGGKTDIHPNVQPTFAAWLMLRQRAFAAELAQLESVQRQSPSEHRARYMLHVRHMADACNTLIAKLADAFSRVDWLAAVALTTQAIRDRHAHSDPDVTRMISEGCPNAPE